MDYTHSRTRIKMKIYEEVFQHYLPPKMPIIIRVDGRAFSSLMSGLDDSILRATKNLRTPMSKTCSHLLLNIPGSSIGFVHGDEINIFITNYSKDETQPWFNNRIDKIVSTSSAMATGYFNMLLYSQFGANWCKEEYLSFDARAFVLPLHDVFDYFKFRQLEGRKNCLLSFARDRLGHSDTENKNLKLLIETLKSKGHNFYELPPEDILGNFFVVDKEKKSNGFTRLAPLNLGPIIMEDNEDIINERVYSGVVNAQNVK